MNIANSFDIQDFEETRGGELENPIPPRNSVKRFSDEDPQATWLAEDTK